MIRKISKIENSAIIVFLCVLLCIGFYLMYAYAHYANDDYYYLYPFYGYKINGAELSFDNLFNWVNAQLSYNIRLANIMTILLLLLPHWVVDVFSVAITVLLIRCVMKLLNIDNIVSLSMSVLVTGFIFVMPWYDQIFYIAFRLNYVWASAVALLFICLYFDKDLESSKIKKFAIIIVAFIASMMHEGISVPILIGIIIQIILSKEKISGYKIAVILFFCVGIIFLIFSPGINSRIVGTMQLRSLISYIIYFIGYNFPSFIFVLLVILAIIRGHYQKMVSLKIPFYVAATMVGCIIFMIFPVIRASWFPTLFSIIGLIVMLRDVFCVRIKHKQITILVLYILAVVHLYISCYYAHIIYKQWDLIAEKYENNVNSNFYTPITLEKDIPSVVMGKAYGFRHQQWGNSIMRLMSDFYRINQGVYAVPDCLKSINKSDLVKIKGDNPFYQVGHYILQPRDRENMKSNYIFKIRPINFLPINVSVSNTKIEYIEFTTETGDTYYLIAANYQALPSILDNVEEINRIK